MGGEKKNSSLAVIYRAVALWFVCHVDVYAMLMCMRGKIRHGGMWKFVADTFVGGWSVGA